MGSRLPKPLCFTCAAAPPSPQIIPGSDGKTGSGTLYAALAENMGLPLTLYGFDVACAIAGNKDVDCVTTKTPWQAPHPALASAPEDLTVG